MELWYPSIMNPIENDKKDTIHNLRVPFEHGWTRELVYSSNNMKNAEVYYECLYNGTELNQYRIRQLLESNTEISPLYKLSLHHLEVKGAERQCVRLASELFSHTVAESVRRNFPKDAVAHKLADFIELVNNWFDIMNSYTPNGIAYKAPYGKDLEEQNRVLDEMYWTIKTMKCFNKKGELQESLQISQKGILMSITSIKGLRKEMEEKFKFRFILTHRTNQDFEENFFSQIRGRNGPIDHPSPVECLYTIKAIILGKNPGIGRHLHSNTIEQDPEEYVSATFMRHLSRDENIDGICERNGDQLFAIKCYQCNSRTDAECHSLGTFKPHLTAGFYKDCTDFDLYNGSTPFCRKTTLSNLLITKNAQFGHADGLNQTKIASELIKMTTRKRSVSVLKTDVTDHPKLLYLAFSH
ncbi:Transposable element P transposase, partial [Pseudolycoriella hygida]